MNILEMSKVCRMYIHHVLAGMRLHVDYFDVLLFIPSTV